MLKPILTFIILILLFQVSAQTKEPAPLKVVPSEKQLAWHEMETYAFIHFTTNTFTDKEWGYGDESEQVFNPTAFDAEQWAKTIKDAGFKAIILTCKHHDGFCLWPSAYTEHSVKNSPFKNGQGDVVKEVSDACRKYGLKFGVYLSPWDRNHAGYGTSEYIEYYRNQLKELFTAYGPVFEMWFDGANGGDGYYGGKREKRQINGSTYYEWPVTLDLVRNMEPNVIFFSDAGPDIRWVGNERGVAGETNWCTISNDTLFAGKSGIEKLLNGGDENGTKWIPAEVDVSIRPGWFYHASEDKKVKTPEQLFDIYLTSVGRGSNLLLNIPPDRRGLLNEIDVQSLMGFKKLLDETFSKNLALNARISASSFRGEDPKFDGKNCVDGNKDTYWATNDDVLAANLEIDLPKNSEVQYVVIQEYIKLGQRVSDFSVEVLKNKNWKTVYRGTTIGYKRIIKIGGIKSDKIRINFLDGKACPVISNVEVY
ncbi:MAG: alpha-L-fucosidase [Bacteroidales bacterium]